MWSGPEISGLDHSFVVQTTGAERSRKRSVRTTIPGSNRRAWFIPEILVSTSSRLVLNRFDGGAQIRCRYSGIHTLNRTHRTVSDARRQPDTATRALSRLRSTWRGSEEADKARMRALPLTSPTAPHGEAARKPVNCTPVNVNCTRPYPRPRWASVLPRANQ